MGTSISQNDPYSRAISELEALAKTVENEDVHDFLLRCDKSGRLSFEKKTFFGKIKRFFTVTLFRSKEYDFDTNIGKIGKLFEAVTPALTNTNLQNLEKQVNQLIERVAKAKTTPNQLDEKIKALQIKAHTSHLPLSQENLGQIKSLQNSYPELSFVEKRSQVLALAEEIQGHDFDNVSKKDAEDICWLAEQCASFFELETSFALYFKVLSKNQVKDETTEKFIELGLLLKRFSAIETVINMLPPKNAVRKTTTARIERIQQFGEGGAYESGFKKGEWEMLVEFSRMYDNTLDEDHRGTKVFAGQTEKVRDFLLYTTGNNDFNKRLRTQLDGGSITDENILSAIDYLASFGFKSDPKKWQTNQVLAEHMVKVQELHDAKETLNEKRELLEKLRNEPDLDTAAFHADETTKALHATGSTTVEERTYIPAKKTKFTRTKARTKITKTKIPGRKAIQPKDWKAEQVKLAKEEREAFIKKLPDEISQLEETVQRLTTELAQLSGQFPKLVGKHPEKMKIVELPVLDSIYRFGDQLQENICTDFEFNKNPVFTAEYKIVTDVQNALNKVQDRCLGEGGYRTGDLSFVNELKKAKVSGKVPSDFVDRAAVALFPFGHMAIIDEEHGYTAFSHQRFAFDHEPVNLSEYLYYDSYRVDVSKVVTKHGYEALEKSITDDDRSIEDEMRARGMTKQEYLQNELQEKFTTHLADELEQITRCGCAANEAKWQGVEKPEFEAHWTLDDLKAWCNKANENRDDSNKFELYELFEVPEECEPEVEDKIRALRVDYLKELYKGITNNEKTQTNAYLKSWLFTGALRVARITDKSIDPRKIEMMGEMCCSQFALLITLRALKRLDDELRGESDTTCVKIPTLTQQRYDASTTEFVLKEYKNILRPVEPPQYIKEIVDLPSRNFLKPIPIDKTVVYMTKRLFGAYATGTIR